VQQAFDLTVIQLSKHATEGSKGSAIRGSARIHPRRAGTRSFCGKTARRRNGGDARALA
jgi:hypothetical protein